MDIIDRKLLETNVLFVTEDNDTLPYSIAYTMSGLPYYTPPDNKYDDSDGKQNEFLFLPVKGDEFINDKDNLFFGFRIMISISGDTASQIINDTVMNITQIEIVHEVGRVRYYPSGERSINIDKAYDSLYPPQKIVLGARMDEAFTEINKYVGLIIDLYCNHYVDRKV